MMVPERLTSAGGSLGMARAALEVAVRYSDRRKAFGQKILRGSGSGRGASGDLVY
jgi:acyl-CoA dehydrogenase